MISILDRLRRRLLDPVLAKLEQVVESPAFKKYLTFDRKIIAAGVSVLITGVLRTQFDVDLAAEVNDLAGLEVTNAEVQAFIAAVVYYLTSNSEDDELVSELADPTPPA